MHRYDRHRRRPRSPQVVPICADGRCLGGLYGGFLNPTEAGAAGALGALVIALVRRSLDAVRSGSCWSKSGQITVSVLFLILAATFFSRMLALSGVPRELAEFFLDGSIGPYGFLLIYLLIIAWAA